MTSVYYYNRYHQRKWGWLVKVQKGVALLLLPSNEYLFCEARQVLRPRKEKQHS